eukprot:ANDGO_06744.mRNA.1 hypothetical protein
MAAAVVPPQSSLSTPVELFVECRNLVNLDVSSKSDPICQVRLWDPARQAWFEVGRTEAIADNLNPKFLTSIKMNYQFERVQKIQFCLWDMDSSIANGAAAVLIPENLHKSRPHDFIGIFETQLANVLCARNQSLSGELRKPASTEIRGLITIRGEEVSTGGIMGTATYNMAGQGLDNKDGMFGKSDPFLVFNRIREDGATVPVFKTEVVKNTLNPAWKPISVTSQALCNGDLDRPILVECFDWDKKEQFELIGSFRASMRSFVPGARFVLWNEEKNAKQQKKGKKYEGSGSIVIQNVQFCREYSLVDFLRAGYEISAVVGIDFTGSNLAPTSSQSLHYIPPGTPLIVDPASFNSENQPSPVNDYESAILSVGSVLAPYDKDGIIPTYGFGAKIPPNWNVSHCFPVNCQAVGIPGVFSSYRGVVTQVAFHGPTLFAPLIRSACQLAVAEPSKYFVLLILTDGEIQDMPDTIDAIIDASALPLSIIIVGIGKEGFENMRVLDADDVPLQRNGRRVDRDCVQFVPFRDFVGKPVYLLAEAVCAELPRQFLQYCARKNITPDAVAAFRAQRCLATAPPP